MGGDINAQLNQSMLFFLAILVAAIIGVMIVLRLVMPSALPVFKRKWTIQNRNTAFLLGIASGYGELVLLQDGYTPKNARFTYMVGIGIIYDNTPAYGVYMVELPFIAACPPSWPE